MNIAITDQDLFNWGMVLVSVLLAMGLGASMFVYIPAEKMTIRSWFVKLILLFLIAVVVLVVGMVAFWIYSIIKFGI